MIYRARSEDEDEKGDAHGERYVLGVVGRKVKPPGLAKEGADWNRDRKRRTLRFDYRSIGGGICAGIDMDY